MNKLTYEALRYFFKAYFTPFWTDEVSTDGFNGCKEIIFIFINDEPLKIIESTISELKFLLQEELSESQLEQKVNWELGANVHPSGMGLSYQKWLENILEILEDNI